MRVFRRILRATDFSRASGRALARAIALARQDRAQLWIAHALPPLVAAVGGGFAFGSVAERVVRLAPCPVLTVRGR